MNYTRRRVLRGALAMGAMSSMASPYASFAKSPHPLNFLNWSDYVAQSNLSSFTQKTGVNIFERHYGSSEEMYIKLHKPDNGMHIACMSPSWAARLIEEGLLNPIDMDKIPNFKNISPAWRGLNFDADNTYHVPYLWGTTGIGYNSAITGDTDMADMKWVLESDKFSGEIAWLDSPYAMVTVAMAYLRGGTLPEKYDPVFIREVFKLFNHQRKHVRVLAPDTGQELLMTGEVAVAVEYNGDICQINSEDSTMKFALPPNGANRWLDVLVLPKAKQKNRHDHMDSVHDFINHMLDAKQGFDLAQTTGYLTPNTASKALLENAEQLCSGDSFFPPADVIDSLPYEQYYGVDFQDDIEERWNNLKASL